MTMWQCPKCKHKEVGPIRDKYRCRRCGTDMVPVVERESSDGKGKQQIVLEKFED